MATLRQLEYLVAIADLGTFTRAAADLHVSQPALSHQIAVLERDVGGSLVDRLPRSARLTPAGRAMLPYARAAIAEAGRGRSAARNATGAAGGELLVAAVYSVSLGVLLAPFQTWHHEHPDVRIRLHEHRHGDEMAQSMRAGSADIAIGPEPDQWAGVTQPLGDEEMVIVLPADDRLAETRKSIALATLADRAWIHYAPGHGLAEVLDAACARAGFTPRVALRVEQTATAPLLAAAGLGPALVPASVIPNDFHARIARTSPPTSRPLTMYFHPSTDPLTLAFAQTVEQHAVLMPPHVAKQLGRRTHRR